jgi:hypothetical protein
MIGIFPATITAVQEKKCSNYEECYAYLYNAGEFKPTFGEFLVLHAAIAYADKYELSLDSVLANLNKTSDPAAIPGSLLDIGDYLPKASTKCSSCGNTETPPTPGLLTQAKSVGIALAKWVASGGSNVTNEVRMQRLLACKVCDKRLESRCSLCGCFVAVKSWLATEECPLQKW